MPKPSATFDFDEHIISNRQKVGFVGENGVCGMFLTDGKDPTVNLNSNSDIYITAGILFQMESETVKHNVTVECTEIYELMNHTVNTDKTSKVGGNYKLEVTGTHDITVTGKQTITAKAAQEIKVSSGGQVVDVTGDRHLRVTGSVNEIITQDRSVQITGKDDLNVLSKSKHVRSGGFSGLDMSHTEALKLSTSAAVSIGAKTEANLALAEVLNVGGSYEQTIALKRIFNASIVKENTVGIKMGENKGINLQKDASMTKEKRNVVDSAATFVKAESKLWKLGAKIAMFD